MGTPFLTVVIICVVVAAVSSLITAHFMRGDRTDE